MIQIFVSSQILAPLSQSNLPKCLRCPKQTKSFLPLWKLRWILSKMLTKGKKLKLSRARIRARIKRKILPNLLRMPQTLLSLSLSKLLIQGLPNQKPKLRTFIFCSICFFLLCLLFLYYLFLKEMYHIFFINEDVSILLHTSRYVMQD